MEVGKGGENGDRDSAWGDGCMTPGADDVLLSCTQKPVRFGEPMSPQ